MERIEENRAKRALNSQRTDSQNGDLNSVITPKYTTTNKVTKVNDRVWNVGKYKEEGDMNT